MSAPPNSPKKARHEWLLLTEVAADYRIPTRTLYDYVHRGIGPPCYKVGRRVMYRRDELEAWMQSAPLTRP